MKLIIYGDFNCPYSAVASYRADALQQAGVADVEWRAVEHDPSIPPGGLAVEGELADELEREIHEIQGLLGSGEQLPMQVPARRPKTSEMCAAHASRGAGDDDALRREAFSRIWQQGGDLSGLRAGVTEAGAKRAEQWQEEWLQTERHIVPMLVLPDGYVSRGLGALKRLADMASGSADAT